MASIKLAPEVIAARKAIRAARDEKQLVDVTREIRNERRERRQVAVVNAQKFKRA